MPLNIDITQILLHILNLVILVGGITLILYRPAAKFLRERREHYVKLEQDLTQKSAECDRLREEYEKKNLEAEEFLSRSRADAEHEAAEIVTRYIDSAKERADAILRAAETEAESRKKHVLESAQAEIGELVLSATQKLLGENATPETDSALYDKFIRRAEEESSGGGSRK